MIRSTIAFLLAFTLSAISLAQEVRFEATPSIQISRLGVFKNQNLTALYVTSEPTPISFDPTGLKVSKIIRRFDAVITSDSVGIPSLDLPRELGRTAYNYLLIIISPTKDFSWVNENGTRPEGDNLTLNNQIHFVKVVSRYQIMSNGGAPLQIPIY